MHFSESRRFTHSEGTHCQTEVLSWTSYDNHSIVLGKEQSNLQLKSLGIHCALKRLRRQTYNDSFHSLHFTDMKLVEYEYHLIVNTE